MSTSTSGERPEVDPEAAPPLDPVVDEVDVTDEGDAVGRPKRSRLRGIIGWVVWIGGALAVGLIVRDRVAEPYQVPSASMESTISPGDWIVAEKFTSDVDELDRGDLVVFDAPPAVAQNVDVLVKRVIALPGEVIAIHDGAVHINGEPLDENYLAAGTTTTAGVLEGPITVPDNAFVALGDNRGNSVDSRTYGIVDGDLLIGRAFVRVWPPFEVGGL